MGSHGGRHRARAGRMLRGLGVTEASVGAPIRATMDVVPVGEVPDGPPYYGRLCCRRRRHHRRRADQAALRFPRPHRERPGQDDGDRAGQAGRRRRDARLWRARPAPPHRPRRPGYRRAARPSWPGWASSRTGSTTRPRSPSCAPAAFGGPEEQRLLETARRLLPGLPFDQLDVLIVDEIGKNYSGAGMDTTVIGRVMVPGQAENPRPQITAIVALDISPESHGNAGGLGMADVTTRRVVAKIDFHSFYLNAITSGTFGLRRSSIPFVMQDDYTALALALHAGTSSHPTTPRLVGPYLPTRSRNGCSSQTRWC